jgi:hypothetical protein
MTDTLEAAQNAPVPVQDQPDPAIPSEKWTFYELESYVRERLSNGTRLENESLKLGMRAAIEVYYAGMALDVIREKRTTKGSWTQWMLDHDLKNTSCYEAIRLFQRVESVEDLRKLTLTEARDKYRTKVGKLWKTKPAEGGNAEGEKKDKVVPKIEYNETAPLKEVRAGFGTLVELVSGIEDDEWKNADPEIYVSQIDTMIARLKQVKQIILVSEKTAKAEHKANAKVTANATVSKASATGSATGSAKEPASVRGAVSLKDTAQEPPSVKATAKPPRRRAAKVSPSK